MIYLLALFLVVCQFSKDGATGVDKETESPKGMNGDYER